MSIQSETLPLASNDAVPINADTRLSARYRQIRDFSRLLSEPLETEDYVVQSMPDVSPTKWHLAHTSWFFETFILKEVYPDYQSPNSEYAYLFNSYYLQAGRMHSRPNRGLVTRPTVAETLAYRSHVDEVMLAFLDEATDEALRRWTPVVDIGLNHEQQHQELMLTDIKHVLWSNPLRPAYRENGASINTPATAPLTWVTLPEGIYRIGHAGDGFTYDNEGPAHRVFLENVQIGNRLVTNGEYQEFIEDGGYKRSELWLSEGWNTIQEEGWQAPLYWERRDGSWWQFTLHGMRPVDQKEPVTHVSYFEADAFARWSSARLATEFEWEAAVECVPVDGNFVENHQYRPVPAGNANGSIQQVFGDVWEWTQSHYSPYPGYRPPEGAIGEYNGKFMCNQFVLRGGSCATSVSHIRRTYRNFFPSSARWQFSGIRLARSI